MNAYEASFTSSGEVLFCLFKKLFAHNNSLYEGHLSKMSFFVSEKNFLSGCDTADTLNL